MRLRVATRLLLALLIVAGAGAAAAQANDSSSLQPALLDTTVNGARGAEPVLFLRGADGRLYAKGADLSAWRMRLPSTEPVRFEGDIYYSISSIHGTRVAISEAEQLVTIDANPDAFEIQRTSLVPSYDLEMTLPATGAFMNYDVFFEHVHGETNVNGAFSLGFFSRHGVGETSFIASAGDGKERLVRLETSWSIDRPDSATSIRIGDSVSSAGPGSAPFRFAGLQYFRNYLVQPGFITMPLPSSSGSAVVPSVVDVFVNNALQSSQQVGAGPFEIANIPVQSGGGNVQIVVRDLLGREVVSEQTYYASTQLLRRGLHDFSYEAGFVRQGFGRRSNAYGGFMASTSHRYGLTDAVTLEGHAQVSRSRQMAGAAVNVLAFDLAQFGASASFSHSEQGVGYRLAASMERRSQRWAIGMRSEYASDAYTVIGLSDHVPPPRLMVQAFADISLSRGSVGVNVIHRSMRERDDETLAGLTASWRISSTIGVQLYARHVIAGRHNTVLGAHVSVGFGGRRSGSASIEHDRGRTSGFLSFQEDAPSGNGGGYRAAASFGDVERVEAAYLHNFQAARVTAHASHSSGRTGLRLSASGSLGLLGGRTFASRSLGESFARVELPGFPNVRVYSDNQLVGVTDSKGSIVVPALRAYDRNVIRIEEADLPMDASIDTVELAVRPFARSGTRVHFSARRERGVLMHVRLEDGQELPAGARIRVQNAPSEYVAVSGGVVYVPDLAGSVMVNASWSGQSCQFFAQVPDNDDPQPLLEGLVCRNGASLASR